MQFFGAPWECWQVSLCVYIYIYRERERAREREREKERKRERERDRETERASEQTSYLLSSNLGRILPCPSQ